MKSFCPIIIFHDQPLANENQSTIDRYRDRMNEMLKQNARFWINDDNEEVVSPSTSTSTSSSPIRRKRSMKVEIKKRRRGNLPKEVTEFLRQWLIEHKKHPYPEEKEKIDLASQTGLTINQISNWFINARRRILQPMLESENLIQAQYIHFNSYYQPYPESIHS